MCLNDFQRFWELYPRKVGKKAAEKAFQKIAMTPQILNEILDALDGTRWPESQYIPHPASWLNGERWTDERESGRPEKPPDRLIKPDGSVLVYENGGWHPEVDSPGTFVGVIGCCGMGTCTKPECYMCTVIAKLPQPETGLEYLARKQRTKIKRARGKRGAAA